MARRFFTADFHLETGILCNKDIMHDKVRPFSNKDTMNNSYIKSCNDKATKDDLIIHIGDLFQYGKDRNSDGSALNPTEFLNKINANFINIKGNHDDTNKVKSACTYMRTSLGKKFTAVSISHYPTTDIRAKGTFRKGDIHLCGHVHSLWKYMIDYKHSCLNINLGVDVWNHQIVSEEDLINYITDVLKRNDSSNV